MNHLEDLVKSLNAKKKKDICETEAGFVLFFHYFQLKGKF